MNYLKNLLLFCFATSLLLNIFISGVSATPSLPTKRIYLKSAYTESGASLCVQLEGIHCGGVSTAKLINCPTSVGNERQIFKITDRTADAAASVSFDLAGKLSVSFKRKLTETITGSSKYSLTSETYSNDANFHFFSASTTTTEATPRDLWLLKVEVSSNSYFLKVEPLGANPAVNDPVVLHRTSTPTISSLSSPTGAELVYYWTFIVVAPVT